MKAILEIKIPQVSKTKDYKNMTREEKIKSIAYLQAITRHEDACKKLFRMQFISKK